MEKAFLRCKPSVVRHQTRYCAKDTAVILRQRPAWVYEDDEEWSIRWRYVHGVSTEPFRVLEQGFGEWLESKRENEPLRILDGGECLLPDAVELLDEINVGFDGEGGIVLSIELAV